jgi:RNA polymerase sigma factor (TIGR02999 family)
MSPQGEITNLLTAWGKGDQNALQELIPLVYDELHRMAQRAWREMNDGNTLQPTALIHEAYLKLTGPGHASYQNRGHFLAVACTAMRQILVNHARDRRVIKRGSGKIALSLDDAQAAVDQEADEVVALHEALERLNAIDKRKSKVVEMRYFGGLSIEDTAEALGVSVMTVNRDWRLARAWLARELNSEPK